MKNTQNRMNDRLGNKKRHGFSYVAKSVSYDDDCAMALVVVHKKDNPTPIEF